MGTLGWMPDLGGFFAAARRLLRCGGWLLVYEMHPILDMFDAEPGGTFPLRHSYFRTGPYADEEGLDYYGNSAYESSISYWFHHRLSDIIQSGLDNGFRLTSFQEYGHDVSNVFKGMEKQEAGLPLSYTLLARCLS